MKSVNRKLYIIDKSYLKEDWQDIIKDTPLWRQEKIDKIIVNEPKKLSLLASILFERMMKDIDINVDIKNIKICFNQYGKPYIEDEKYKNIKFNISHTREKAILFVSEDEVGCDIEKIHDIDLNIAKRFFTKDEYNYIKNLKDIKTKQKVFYKMWTMKESIAKYIGKGLYIGLDSVDFSDFDYIDMFLKKEKQKATSYFYNGQMICFYNYDIDDYMITICTKGDKSFSVVNIL